ncbi:MAG: hypothetical protein ACI88L_000065 [Candidatus Paceibacteria bacterium]|jgi:hypothetical protein
MKKTAIDWFPLIVDPCKEQAKNKAEQYGSSWTIYRPAGLRDKLFIKASRIRTIQEAGENKVGESIEGEFQAILNYSLMGLIQIERGFEEAKLYPQEVLSLYEKESALCLKLMEKKNHDYGEAWRGMSQEGITDEILVKLSRTTEKIRAKAPKKDLRAEIEDIVNYAIFALIQIQESSQ